MAVSQLDTENADRDITSIITVLTDTPDTSNALRCQGLVKFGDGSKNLDGTGGLFEFTVSVGGQVIQPNPQVILFDTSVRAAVLTIEFSVPANEEVLLRVKSPNAADSDVDVTAELYDVSSEAGLALDVALSELGVAAPTATPTVRTALMLLYMTLRNKITVTATAKTISNNAGTTIASKTLSDDGTTYTEDEAS